MPPAFRLLQFIVGTERGIGKALTALHEHRTDCGGRPRLKNPARQRWIACHAASKRWANGLGTGWGNVELRLVCD